MKTDIQKIKKLLGLSGDKPLTPEEKRRRAKRNAGVRSLSSTRFFS